MAIPVGSSLLEPAASEQYRSISPNHALHSAPRTPAGSAGPSLDSLSCSSFFVVRTYFYFCVCVRMNACHVCEHLWRPEEDARLLGTGVIGCRERPNVNAGKRTHVLWKGMVCSSPSYHFRTQLAICGGTNKGLCLIVFLVFTHFQETPCI